MMTLRCSVISCYNNSKKAADVEHLRAEQDITNNWNTDIRNPLVSIICIAYMHEKFIEDALRGFLRQKTEFPFEILIHDDASTDKTADVIREYTSRYPNIIRPILQVENQLSKGISPENILEEKARGQYLAYCEGDDYWSDQSKLQKQVDFMNSHSECTICGHRVKVYNHELSRYKGVSSSCRRGTSTLEEYLVTDKPCLPTLSIMYSRNMINTRSNHMFKQVSYSDYLFKILCAKQGKIGFINEIMGVYREHQNSMTHNNPASYAKKRIQNFECMRRNFCEYDDIFLRKLIHARLLLAFSCYSSERRIRLDKAHRVKGLSCANRMYYYKTLIFLYIGHVLFVKHPKLGAFIKSYIRCSIS